MIITLALIITSLLAQPCDKVPEGYQTITLTDTGAYAVSRGDIERKTTSVVTAYTWTGNVTAIGTYPVEGRTCAGPRWIPLGTVVYIEGVGERIVEDRTHIRFNGRYDVYMDSYDACIQFGKQNLKVEVLQ